MPPETPAAESPTAAPRGWTPMKKVLAVAAAAPAVLLFAGVAIFVARVEWAYSEDRCPFAVLETRTLAPGIQVREDSRQCTEGSEEHRWIVLRDTPPEGQLPTREIGRRRLPSQFYAPSRSRWKATLENSWVHIHIHNDGVEPASFREDPPPRKQH